MAYVINYDEPITLYKVNLDGETAQTLTVLGKKAIDVAVDQGWQIAVPFLRYPNTLYRLDGTTKIVHSRVEEEEAERNGWDHIVRAAPAAPPENFGPLVPETVIHDGALALKLMDEQEKRHELEKEMAMLRQQNAEILELLRNPAKAKPGPKPKGPAAA